MVIPKSLSFDSDGHDDRNSSVPFEQLVPRHVLRLALHDGIDVYRDKSEDDEQNTQNAQTNGQDVKYNPHHIIRVFIVRQ